MPDIPQEAVDAAVAAYAREGYCDGEPIPGDVRVIRAALEAAAPFMAEAVAAKIKAHGEKYFGHMRSARVRFDIAARIAAGAFDTKEDRIRMITEALEHGNYIACNFPEAPAKRERMVTVPDIIDGCVAFIAARLDEAERTVYAEGDPPRGVIAWLTLEDADGNLQYTTVAHGDAPDGPWTAHGDEVTPSRPPLVVYDPHQALRAVEFGRWLLAEHARFTVPDSDRARAGVIGRILRRYAAQWSGHEDYEQEWAS